MEEILNHRVPSPVKHLDHPRIEMREYPRIDRNEDKAKIIEPVKSSLMKENRIVLFFETSKVSKRQPDISGKLMFKERVCFVALWKTDSKYDSGVFWGGVVHEDREKTRKIGTMRIYKSKYYDANAKGPLMYGRLYHANQVTKLYLWPKQGKQKAYLTGKLIS